MKELLVSKVVVYGGLEELRFACSLSRQSLAPVQPCPYAKIPNSVKLISRAYECTGRALWKIFICINYIKYKTQLTEIRLLILTALKG